MERTSSWHARGFEKLEVCTGRRTRVLDAFTALANAVIITRRLIRTAWTTHIAWTTRRWDTRPARTPGPRDVDCAEAPRRH